MQHTQATTTAGGIKYVVPLRLEPLAKKEPEIKDGDRQSNDTDVRNVTHQPAGFCEVSTWSESATVPAGLSGATHFHKQICKTNNNVIYSRDWVSIS